MHTACVIGVAIRVLFENHTYEFGNKIFKKESGGLIGDRWTSASARNSNPWNGDECLRKKLSTVPHQAEN